MLKVALLGALHTETSLLARDLERSVAASGWPAVIVAQTGAAALPAIRPDYDLVLLTGLETALASATPQASRRADNQQVARLASSSSAPAASLAAVEQVQQAADAAIRAALAEAGVSYQVLYGSRSERLTQARAALESLLPAPAQPPAQAVGSRATAKPAPWVWLCDKCSDPQCEHRLLTALLARRAPKTEGLNARLGTNNQTD